MAENGKLVLDSRRLFVPFFADRPGVDENKGEDCVKIAGSVSDEVELTVDSKGPSSRAVFGECVPELEDVMYFPDLCFIIKFVDELAGELGCRDAAFFKHEEAVESFRNSFLEFSTLVSEELEDISEIIRRSKMYTHFSANWKSIIRRASYYAFVVHFGAKRRGEVNSDGSLQDYVRHVMRTGFNHVIRKARILDERELAVAILHDTREDWHKGFAWLLHLDEEQLNLIYSPEKCDSNATMRNDPKTLQKRLQAEKSDVVLGKMTEIEGKLDSMLGERVSTDLSISELVCLLTKAVGETDRNRTLLNMLRGILSYKNPSQRVDALVVLLLKICDRLDNIKSLMSSRAKTDTGITKLEQIKDETILFFLGFAKEMGMQNVAEWLKDYLSVQDNELRRRWTDMRRTADKTAPEGDRELSRDERLRTEFAREFHELLCEKLGVEGRDLVEGRDYILEFRPIGIRGSDFEEDKSLAESGEYSKGFRHYLTFYPVLESRVDILNVGVNVFKTLFPDPLDSKILERGELKCSFGQAFLEQRKKIIPIEEHGYSEKYGHGVYCLFQSQKDAVAMLLGKWHMARHYNCLESRTDVLGLMDSINGEVDHIAREYAILDRWSLDIGELDSAPEVREGIRTGHFAMFKELIGLDISGIRKLENSLYKAGFKDKKARASALRNVLGKLVMMLPMKKDRVKVIVNGVPIVRDIPKGLSGMEILPWVDVKLLGLPIKEISYVGDNIVIQVKMFGFNEELFKHQVGDLPVRGFRNVGDIAHEWKAKLLSDEI